MMMWLWIGLFVGAVVLAAFWMDRRRGSTGDARDLDLPGTKQGRPRHIDTNDGFNGM
ncbi:hypothetical protein [Oryzobacter telluris]|uniref:hypothetical protein n=1 Tax=Oryzobacter telluris TaxID=3149179 RepID=UPI00370DC640